MEQPSTSSNVTVEYADPSGTYPSLSPELRRRLPLRHLHWKSSSRPVRTIDSLHVTLIADEGPLDANDNRPAPKGESPRKERRHQIPGLRQTPYLKIYFLQCIDVDNYKVNSRKLLRDWVKDHTPPSQSSTSLTKQENHDAFEWLIVHVLPASADEDTSRPSSVARTESEKRSSSSRWPSRSSSSVIEKIRVDFNGTSKNAVDRVAQVQVADYPGEDSGGGQLRSQDDKNGWGDFVAKMKSLILASFDLRVNQYEEDIREKELQRNLPGWNYNTFFVLKEGLARGFENVGLTEDALTGYHELAAGLNAIVDVQSGKDTTEQQAALFSDYTEDLVESFKQMKRCSKSTQTSWHEKPQVVDLGACILNTDRKPFRDLILANKISSFDFQCYVFARQVSLLLRLADVAVQSYPPTNGAIFGGGSDAHSDVGTRFLKPSGEDREDLTILAEVAQRASNFINSVATTIRNDIRSGIHPSDDDQDENGGFSYIVHEEIVENLVASWVFSASRCILEATSANSLSAQLDPLLRQLKSSIKSSMGDNERGVGPIIDTVYRKGLPDRTSSLKAHASVLSHSPIQENFPSVTLLDAVRLLPPATFHPGAQELASRRGDLLALARRALSGLGLQHVNRQGGLADLGMVSGAEEEEMHDVKLEDTREQEEKPLESLPVTARAPTTAGLCNRMLFSALQSKNDFYQAFEESTVLTLANYVIGGRTKAAEGMTVDLAVTRFLLEDYEVAASYFRQLTPFYAKDDWSDLELLMLDLYAQCLHHMERNEDYVRIGLKVLAKTIRSKAAIEQQPQETLTKLANIHQPRQCAMGSLSGILSASKSLKELVSLPMDTYFDPIDMGMYVRHSPDDDGFQFPLVLRSLLPESFLAESVRVQILSVEEDQRSELWLHANGQNIEPGTSSIWLGSNTMFPAWYVLNQVTILSGNILFSHSLSPPSDGLPFASSRYSTISGLTNRRRLLLWPQFRSLEARLSHSEHIHLERTKSIAVKISSGWNEIIQGRLSLRAASAGLRLHTARAEIWNGKVAITDKSQPGSIFFGQFHSNITADVNIPYSLESDLKEIVVRAEVTYATERGEFVYACGSKISTVLPITINVRDTFKKSALFSTFTVGTANSIPVKILKCTIEGNEDFSATSQILDSGEHDVFVRQPLSLISRIYRTLRGKRDLDANETAQRKLFLHVEYRCLDQEILTVAEIICLKALAATPMQKLSRLLTPALLETLHSRFSTQQLEMAGLLREIDVGTFDDYGWGSSILAGLPPDLGEELARWLRNWHDDHPTISFRDIDRTLRRQHLTVPFDVPHVQILHTVQMRPMHNRAAPCLQPDFLALGSALPLEVVIRHTRKWWDADARSRNDGKPLDFKYEVHALPDDWTIGGQRKGHFSAKADESLNFAILLLPQRTGHLMFPSIDIHLSQPPHVSHRPDDREDSAESWISCETDYQHQSETILVVSGLSSTTVSVDPSSMVGGTWLVGSKSR